jgi:tRNA A-37 threonylcarbamoyl transferase component Bud32
MATVMQQLDERAWQQWLTQCERVEQDGHGVKVLRCENGDYIKVFRIKHAVSMARLQNPALRFCANADSLYARGIASVVPQAVYSVPSQRRFAVRYTPLAGETLRDLQKTGGLTALHVAALGAFIAQLHRKGIYFRSLHLGNVVLMADGALGLIDVLDCGFRWFGCPLNSMQRARNFRHLFRYPEAQPMEPAVMAAYQQAVASGSDGDKNNGGDEIVAMAPSLQSWWQRDGDWVEPPNMRRNGQSGVKRVNDPERGLLYVKLQSNHLYRSLRFPFGRPTALRERDALHALRALGIPVPETLYAGDEKTPEGWRAVLVTHSLDGYVDMVQWYKQGGRECIGEGLHQQLLQRLGAVLGRLHAHGWQHTNLYPNHVFFCEPAAGEVPAVALIDVENSRQVWWRARAAHRDLAQLHKRCTMLGEADWQMVASAHATAIKNTEH